MDRVRVEQVPNRHSGAMRKHRTRNPEIPGSRSARPGMTCPLPHSLGLIHVIAVDSSSITHNVHLTDAQRIDWPRLIRSDRIGPHRIMAQTPPGSESDTSLWFDAYQKMDGSRAGAAIVGNIGRDRYSLRLDGGL